MANLINTPLNVFDVLARVYGPRGLPFPTKPKTGHNNVIANGFVGDSAPALSNTSNVKGTAVKKITDASLGKYEFMPVTINDVQMPNAVIIISGEKHIVQHDLMDVGTVFEKVFTKPYDISIIVTLIGENGEWPEEAFNTITTLWKENDLVTLRCALTDFFIDQTEDNFIISKISVLDNSGSECVEVIQIDGLSNKDFVLEFV